MTTTYNLPAEIRVLAKATINKNSEKDNFYIKLLFDKDFNKLKSSDIEKLQKDNYSQVIIDKFIKKKSTQKSEYLKINDLFDVYCENILRDPIDTEIIDLMTNSGVDLTREVLQDKDIIAYLKMLVVFDASELSSQKQLIIEKELSLALKKEAMNRKDLIDFI